MKTKLSILFLSTLAVAAFFFSCTKNTTPPQHKPTDSGMTDSVNLKKGLLLYLPFSGSIADSSGNNNPTAFVNGASLGYDEHGYANNAFGSDGTNRIVQVTNNGSIRFDTALSISLDFMTMDANHLHTYLSMVDWATGNGPSFSFGQCMSSDWSVFDYAFADVTGGCDNSTEGNTKTMNDTTSFKPVFGRWYNVVVIYRPGLIKFYLNGRLYSSKTGTSTAINFCPASKINVGGWWISDPGNINGAVDNVRMYNRVLNAQEITALATNYQVTSNRQKPALQSN